MCVNGKLRPVETVPGTGERDKGERWEVVNLTMVYCKNFCKCYNVPPI
jgi:hypothetical protein